MTPVILRHAADAVGSLRLPVTAVARVAPAAEPLPLQRPQVDAAVPPLPAPATTASQGSDAAASAPAAAARETAALEAAALKADLQALREQAVREGHAQGHAQAQALAEEQTRAALQAEVQRWRRGLEAMQAALQSKLQALEPMAVMLSYEALAMLLGRAYADGSGIEQSTLRLLRAASGASRLRVQLPPAQLQRVQAALEEQAHGLASSLCFEADAALGEHDCRVVSERGILETGLAVQLQAVQAALLAAAGEGQA